MDGLFEFPNVAGAPDEPDPILLRGRRCQHCDNTFYVLLDAPVGSEPWMMPCPMCAGGGRRNEFNRSRHLPHWRGLGEVRLVSWAGGLTVDHQRLCEHAGCHTLVTPHQPLCNLHTR